jgi:hypothetical protein
MGRVEIYHALVLETHNKRKSYLLEREMFSKNKIFGQVSLKYY